MEGGRGVGEKPIECVVLMLLSLAFDVVNSEGEDE